MPISKTNELYTLIRSLSKAEKRSFRLYAERIQSSEKMLYMNLFDIMDKQKVLDEKEIKSKLENVTTSAFSNAKRHLYEQILVSLRLVNKSKKPNISVRELIDFAYLLYGKGLYMQALKILEKAKKLSTTHQFDFNLQNILEIEKMIHSRYITRSQSDHLDNIIQDSKVTNITISNRIELSNLRLILHKFYVEKGHIHNAAGEKKIKAFFAKNMPKLDLKKLGHMEQIHLYQSYVWCHYILYDFENCFTYALKWVEVLQENEVLKSRDVNLFLRGYHYMLTSAFYQRDLHRHSNYLQELESYRKKSYPSFNENSKIISFLYVHQARLNDHILNGTYKEAVLIIPKTLKRLTRYSSKLDEHKIMLFYYKVAWIFLANGQASQAMKYLNQIINMSKNSLRSDIQVYARLMFLIAHYELENFSFIKSLVDNYGSFIDKLEIKNQSQIQFLQFFREVYNAPLLDRKTIMKKHLKALRLLRNDTFEKWGFVYLDSIQWMESKISKRKIKSY